MIFQSFEFVIFFCIVCLSVFLSKGRTQQIILLLASIYFYAYGSLPHTLVFLFVILWTYVMGLFIGKLRIQDDKTKVSKRITALAIGITFLPLAIYKYLPFVVLQIPVLETLGLGLDRVAPILPIGISFFSFQAVGYLIDVYRKKTEPERDIVIYMLFISFFPQLIAGPIERSTDLIKQIKVQHSYNATNMAAGLRLMGVGLFLKVFVADNISYIVDYAYGDIVGSTGWLLLVATFLFGIQIYCDFNGYTMIARGASRILGIELMRNFNHPYLSTSISEFWRRWHRSLSYWFRDYLYIPLGGSHCTPFRCSLNLMITFVLSGLWHGANWTFVIWGAINGCFLVFERQVNFEQFLKKSKVNNFLGWMYSLVAINFSWVFFRSDSLASAVAVLKKIFFLPKEGFKALFSFRFILSQLPISGLFLWKFALSLIGVVLIGLIAGYETKNHRDIDVLILEKSFLQRWVAYISILFITLGFGCWSSTSQFIYFRF
jgi:D-alanyl-lipoteichoic acid acyltransferase DltB (MBOAT superfamily)